MQRQLNPILIDNLNFPNCPIEYNSIKDIFQVYLMQFCLHDVMSHIQSAWKIRSNGCINIAL